MKEHFDYKTKARDLHRLRIELEMERYGVSTIGHCYATRFVWYSCRQKAQHGNNRHHARHPLAKARGRRHTIRER